MMNKTWLEKLFLGLASTMLGVAFVVAPLPAKAKTIDCNDPRLSMNDIQFWNPCESECVTDGASVGTLLKDVNLPEDTIAYLDNMDIKKMVEANKERYEYGEKETKVPFQILAALHFREGGLKSDSSIANGEPLGRGISVDGVEIGDTPNEDAKLAGEHFIAMAKSVYDIDVVQKGTQMTMEDWGGAFLAYNRGYIYREAGSTWEQSPYVMNGLDDKHAMPMSWSVPGEERTGTGGSGSDMRPGALAVVAYLGGIDLNTLGDGCAPSGGRSGRDFPGYKEVPADGPDPMIFYDQCDEKWGDELFNGRQSMCKLSCGVTSLAMVVANLADEKVTPLSLEPIACRSPGSQCPRGSNVYANGPIIADKFGLKYEDLGGSVDEARRVIDQGGLVILNSSAGSQFSGVNHWLVLRKFDGDKFYTANTGGTNYYPKSIIAYDVSLLNPAGGINSMHGFTK